MSINSSVIQGRIPFDLELKGTEKTPVLIFKVSVRRDYKPEGAQYYPEDMLTCKAFGKTAEFISKFFKKGDGINIVGSARMDDDYEKDGQQVKGQMYIHVDKVSFLQGAGGGNGEEGKAAPKTKQLNEAPVNPLAKKKSMFA